MDEDVNKAIKQLETIAIKAMRSGYLDDAAKVMHIAEEIERVDKSGLMPETPGESELVIETSATPELRAAESVSIAPVEAAEADSANVVPLNKFKMKRGAVQPSKPKDSPTSQSNKFL